MNKSIKILPGMVVNIVNSHFPHLYRYDSDVCNHILGVDEMLLCISSVHRGNVWGKQVYVLSKSSLGWLDIREIKDKDLK